MDEAFYLGLARELQGKLRRVSSFVAHPGAIGTYHEEALRATLRPMLSNRFSLRTGFIWYSKTEASLQGDIIAVDESKAGAYYFREGEFAILDSSAVACVIQVKTALNKQAFLDGVQNLASFKWPGGAIKPALLFAYESAPFTHECLNDWYRAVDLPDALLFYPWAIFALNQGLLYTYRDSAGEWSHRLVMGDEGDSLKVRSLSVFLQIFRKALLLHAGDDTNPFELALWDGLSLSKQSCRFGKGVVEGAAS